MPRAASVLLVLLPYALGCPGGQAGLEPVTPAAGTPLDPAVERLLAEHLARVRADPLNAGRHGSLALVYEANELWAEAAASFERAAVLDRSQPLWRFHRAIALQALGDPESALELFLALEQELPELAALQQRIGETLLARGQAKRARAAFRRTIELAPDRPEGHAGLGAAELALGDAGAALSALQRAVTLDPGYRPARYQLGLACRELGRPEAERELARGVGGRTRFMPDPLTAELRGYAVARTVRLQQALSWLEAGRPERAVPILQALLAEHPDDVTLLNNLAIALQRSGEVEPALALLQRALKRDRDVPSTWINLSVLLAEQGMLGRALEHAQRAVELAPDSARAQLALGRALLSLERYEPAFSALTESRRLDPREADVLALLARSALELGRPDDARAHLAELARLAPEHPDVADLERRLERP